MRDLNTLTFEDFELCLSQSFTVRLNGDESLEFELIEAKKRGCFDPKVHTRQAFSLLFRGPTGTLLPQRLYEMEHATLGELMLFLVPVGPDRQGMLYDVTFA